VQGSGSRAAAVGCYGVVMQPVATDQRVHVDYLPSQVVTEFVRDYEFQDETIDGISYASTVHPRDWIIDKAVKKIDSVESLVNAKRQRLLDQVDALVNPAPVVV
jgi:hypothetical protein